MTRINTNVQSLIARRVMDAQNQALNRSLERLSTGLRINSGRDDPSGLIASESLRSTKVALSAAIDNARRADSVVNVAEGSLREVNTLLLELEDLVDRSANEGGLSQDELTANQIQIDTILQSINRIADSASFNDIDLLNGDLAFTTSGVTASANTGGTSLYLRSAEFGDEAFISLEVLDGSFATTSDSVATSLDHGVDGTVIINGAQAVVDGLKAKVNAGSVNLQLTLDADFAQQTATPANFQITGGGAAFAISPDVGLAGQETIGLQAVNISSLGTQSTGRLSSLTSGESNDLDSQNFAVAQRIVREAINQIGSMRGRIGAFQKDTLETTINSLLVTQENITAAESAIRDADFAAETSALTRAQILANSSMLTLQAANQRPASILQLLG